MVKIFARSSLNLYANAKVSSCSSNSQQTFQYQWTSSSNGNNVNILSSSLSPSQYILKPYSLIAGQIYSVTVLVNVTDTKGNFLASSSASVEVIVNVGPVYPIITGGNYWTISTPTTLDASNSYTVNSNTGITNV